MRALRPLLVLACAAAVLTPGTASAQAPAPQIFVATTGNDANPGTAEAPVATIAKGLQLATGGQEVIVRAGAYPAFADRKARTSRVTVKPDGAVTVAGASLEGSQLVTLERIAFSGPVSVAQHPILKAQQRPKGIELRGVRIGNTGKCLNVRGVDGFLLENSYLHDCRTGIAGPGNAEPSYGVTLRRNLVERMEVDGLQFGDWSNVLIEGNVFRTINDPTGEAHNDAIQLTGDTRGLVVRANWLIDSRDQLMLVQDAFGPIDDVLIENNVMVGSGAYAVQLQGATRAIFRHNTVWESRYSAVLVRGGRSGDIPTDTVVVNNVLGNLKLNPGVRLARNEGNFELCDPTNKEEAAMLKSGRCISNPGFMDTRGRNLRLHRNAFARRIAVGSEVGTDILGAPRSSQRAPGAFG